MKKIKISQCTQVFLVTVILSFISGCATQTKSIALGGSIGTGTGAIVGGLIDPGKDGEYRTRNVVVGAALGGMAGMISGSLLHEEIDSQKKEAFLKGKASAAPQKSGTMPLLKTAKVEARWIEGKVVGNRFIDGHYEYVIIEPARWESSE